MRRGAEKSSFSRHGCRAWTAARRWRKRCGRLGEFFLHGIRKPRAKRPVYLAPIHNWA
ncbi:hypothetical protein PCL1606_11450 [Pseudomonas chlororaphis]|uniref:Uncharacterized protein n=1 Tax=Pseudomonas chlororaphis TaxID=587753 RepID=A0A0D5XUT9_9PSED|nr:hypothetical protein PCL1606_11450 [Pseudomonas chlororaphis]